jgi:hypothetical protein
MKGKRGLDKDAAKRPKAKEGGREEENRFRISTGLQEPEVFAAKRSFVRAIAAYVFLERRRCPRVPGRNAATR